MSHFLSGVRDFEKGVGAGGSGWVTALFISKDLGQASLGKQ